MFVALLSATTLGRGRIWLAALVLVGLSGCMVDSSGLSGAGAAAGQGGGSGGSGGALAATGGATQAGRGGGTGGLVSSFGGTPATGGTAPQGTGGSGRGGAGQTGGGTGGVADSSGGQPGTQDAGVTDGGAGGSVDASASGGSTGAGGGAGSGGRAGTGGWWGGTGGWWGGTGGTTALPMCDSSLRDKTACTPGSVTCSKNCGVDDLATKPCSCVAGNWSCGTCTYPPGDYSCYQIPASGVQSCGPGTTNGVTSCFGMCSLCSGYLDSTGTPKDGYCACLNDGSGGGVYGNSVYRCASSAEWPPQQ